MMYVPVGSSSIVRVCRNLPSCSAIHHCGLFLPISFVFKWGQDGGLRTVLLGKSSSTSILGEGGGGNPWLLFKREELLSQYDHFTGLSWPCQIHAMYECRAIHVYMCTVAYTYLHSAKHVLPFLFIGKECFC